MMSIDDTFFKNNRPENQQIQPQEADFFPHNPNKKQICEVNINSIYYPVYEYDLRDVCFIERLLKVGGSESDVTLTMLKLAIPNLSEDSLFSLTQSQSSELISQINATTMMSRLSNISTTFH